jgi:hypothetical protein
MEAHTNSVTIMHRSRFTILLFVCTLGCTPIDHQPADDDPFIADLISGTDRIPIESVLDLKTEESGIHVPMHAKRVDRDRFIVVDGLQWTIHLISAEGAVLDRVGGTGRGPGEYQGINHLEVTDTGELYVLDSSLQRITQYRMRNGSIIFERIWPLRFQPGIQMYRSIHAVGNDRYAVALTTRPHRRLELHALDDSFQTVTIHHELKPHFPNIHFSHTQLTNAKWFVDPASSTFNYIYMDSLNVMTVRLPGSTAERHVILSPHRNRVIHPINQRFLDSTYVSQAGGRPAPDASPKTFELPHTTQAARHMDNIAIQLIYYGGSSTTILIHNLSNRITRYIEAPPGFFLMSFTDHELLGKVTDADGHNRLLVMRLSGD